MAEDKETGLCPKTYNKKIVQSFDSGLRTFICVGLVIFPRLEVVKGRETAGG